MANTRPNVPVTHSDEVEHRRLLAMRANAALPKDGTERAHAPIPLVSLTVSQLTGAYAADLWEGSIIYVSDASGGAITAFSDGTSWRRQDTRAVVS